MIYDFFVFRVFFFLSQVFYLIGMHSLYKVLHSHIHSGYCMFKKGHTATEVNYLALNLLDNAPLGTERIHNPFCFISKAS